jgi:hypothetical protein
MRFCLFLTFKFYIEVKYGQSTDKNLMTRDLCIFQLHKEKEVLFSRRKINVLNLS